MAHAVRDPLFWNRFSLAAHQQAGIRSIISDNHPPTPTPTDTEKAAGVTTTTTVTAAQKTPWLSKQHKKRRRYWIFFWIVLVVIAMLCGALAGVVTYLKSSHMND